MFNFYNKDFLGWIPLQVAFVGMLKKMKGKLSMKKFFSIFFILVLLGVNLQIASAATTPTPTFSYNLTWNIRSIYYYTDSAAQSGYGTPISNAAQNWYYPGWTNSLYPASRTTNQSNSAIDFHTYWNEADGANGYTDWRIFGSSTVIDPDSTNWDWAAIYLNVYSLSGRSQEYIQGVVAHEMGHAFGLAHNNTNPNSIMCQAISGRAVYTVQQFDNDAFNRKHP